MKLSDERIKELWLSRIDSMEACRAIEREAYRNGQEAMKKLAIYAIPINATPMEACAAIGNLETEEPKC